jgi:hypothetical protein
LLLNPLFKSLLCLNLYKFYFGLAIKKGLFVWLDGFVDKYFTVQLWIMKVRDKKSIIGMAVAMVFSLTLSSAIFANAAVANGFEVTNPNVEVVSYDAVIDQRAGTQGGYVVRVKNIGDVNLDKVYIEVSFLPKSWYSLGEPVRLEIDKTADIAYTLTPPADALGSLNYNIIVKAERGFGVVFETSKQVELTTDGAIAQTTTTTTSATTTSPIPTITITQTTTTTAAITTTTSANETTTKSPNNIFSTNIELPEFLQNYWGILIGVCIVVIVIIAYAVKQIF